ncbi:MAG: pyruvate, phosphate dikinase, partial [Myxococcales bacterium]|nr:pyruvate, phosphate dikinase [Myxococcales bacterium]
MAWVQTFLEGDGKNKALLGGKGAGLCEMTRLGLPVPTGFVITTEACTNFLTSGEAWPEGLAEEVEAAVQALEQRTGKRFGDHDNPLLVSVRSGAAVSMPGMMDTVLNLGLNRETAGALARATGNPRFAWDSYRRFIQMFGDVVLGIHY